MEFRRVLIPAVGTLTTLGLAGVLAMFSSVGDKHGWIILCIMAVGFASVIVGLVLLYLKERSKERKESLGTCDRCGEEVPKEDLVSVPTGRSGSGQKELWCRKHLSEGVNLTGLDDAVPIPAKPEEPT